MILYFFFSLFFSLFLFQKKMSNQSTSKAILRTDDANFTEELKKILYEEEDNHDEIFSDEEEDENERGEGNFINDSEDEDDCVCEVLETELQENSDSDFSSDGDESEILQKRRIFSNDNLIRNPDVSLNIPFVFLGKDNTKWDSEESNHQMKVKSQDIIRGSPVLGAPAKILGLQPSPKEVWNLLFDNDMVNEIVKWTNRKLSDVRKATVSQLGSEKKNLLGKYRPTDINEINAFFGILLLTSIYKSASEDVGSLFSSKTFGRQIFRAIMSGRRFEVLSTCLRFDNPDDRAIRKKSNKAAPISWLFERFVTNCQKAFIIGELTCVDEMLVPFRGRCPFKVYMPKKPAKYGIRIRVLADARNFYFYNGYIYTGKDSDSTGLDSAEQEFSLPMQAVLKLAKCIKNSGRNVTTNNYFCSIPLCKELSKHGLTIVSTLSKDKREIPSEFQADRRRPVKSSLFGFSGDITLLSYVPKKKKNILLVSTMHNLKEIDGTTGKPEMLLFYNKTKGGVDALDNKCSKFSSGRKTRRWPLAIFFRIVDICLSNTHLLYLCHKNNPLLKRFNFVQELVNELIRPHLEARRNTPISRELQNILDKILGTQSDPIESDDISDRLIIRKTCTTCNPKLKRKTNYKCTLCHKPICLQCSKKMCNYCVRSKVFLQ